MRKHGEGLRGSTPRRPFSWSVAACVRRAQRRLPPPPDRLLVPPLRVARDREPPLREPLRTELRLLDPRVVPRTWVPLREPLRTELRLLDPRVVLRTRVVWPVERTEDFPLEERVRVDRSYPRARVVLERRLVEYVRRVVVDRFERTDDFSRLLVDRAPLRTAAVLRLSRLDAVRRLYVVLARSRLVPLTRAPRARVFVTDDCLNERDRSVRATRVLVRVERDFAVTVPRVFLILFDAMRRSPSRLIACLRAVSRVELAFVLYFVLNRSGLV